MFLSSNIKYPFLPIVSALKFNTRLIQLSSRNCIRRKPVRHTEPFTELQYSEREIGLNPCKLNSNVNFFGIDSDEGVIIIDSKNSENIIEPNNRNRKQREKFFRSSFGVIRQDSDNKIRFHGQYESDIGSSFPHKSTDIAEVSGEFRQIESNIFNTSHNNKSGNKLKSNNNDYSFMKSYSAQNSHVDSACNDDIEEELNPFGNQNSVQHFNENIIGSGAENGIVDTDFSKLRSSSYQKDLPSSGNLESTFNKDEVQAKCSQNSSINESKVSYIDESFFQGVHEEDNFIKGDGIISDHHKEWSSYISSSNLKSVSCTDDTIAKDNLLSQPNENHVNYIEKHFFPDADENNSSVKSLSVTHSNEKDFSYLDESYFGNIVKDQKLADNESYQENVGVSNGLLSDNIAPDAIAPCNIVHDLSSANDTKYFTTENNKSNIAEGTKLDISKTSEAASFADFFPPISVNNIVSEQQVCEKTSDIVNKSNFSNLNIVEKTPFNENIDDVSEVQYVLNEQDSSDYLNNLISSILKSYPDNKHLRKYNDIFPNSGIRDSTTDLSSKTRLNDISHNLEIPKSVNKIESAETRSASNVSVTSNANNAHDYVVKLRKKQELEESEKDQKGVKTSSSVKVEKLDSKGFRILKDQVPNLSHCTREEVLDILKRSILHLDDNMLILNKPYSLIMHDSQTTKSPCLSMFLDDLAKELDQEAADPKLFTVHRLDKETTGCLLLARNEIAAQKLKSLIAQRKIIKRYWIVTSRVPDPLKGIIDIPISEGSIRGKSRMVLHPDIPKDIGYKSHSRTGKRAVTSYKVLCISGNAALVEVLPETGIKHQIRVHFGFGLSCPILGDHKYSHIDKLAPQKLASDLLQRLHVRQSKVRYIPMHIHSKSIAIPNYEEGKGLLVVAPLPSHMSTNLKKLKFKKKNQLFL